MKLLVVGQAPSRVMEPNDIPLWGTSALTRLASYSGVAPRERLYDLAAFTNLIEDYPGPQRGNEKYDAFPTDVALKNVPRVLDLASSGTYTHVVLLGSGVRKVMHKALHERGTPEFAWFSWHRHAYALPSGSTRYFNIASSPHPGGTSLWWNDSVNRQRGRAFWTLLFAELDRSRRLVDSLVVGESGKKTAEGL